MVVLPINGIEVDFPYEPYGAQIRYMSRVIDALRGGANALLESPTGTGKTLCLLCAALAWRATYVAALQAHARARPSAAPPPALLAKAGLAPPPGAAAALAALARPAAAPQLSAPRVVFSSRTHSQLSQAVRELQKTAYRPAMAMLASRDQLCVHPVAATAAGPRLNAACRRLTAPAARSARCRFHAPAASPRPHENRAAELVDKMNAAAPMDIEDLRAFGEREGACPWFLSRAAAKADECEILFLPYNYLLDRSARGSLGIDWSNDIVIIDEAHNLESVCSESMSFDLSDPVRKACDAELSKLVEHAVRPGGLSIPALEKLAQTEKGMESVIGSERCEINEIRLMRTILRSLEEFVDSVQFDRGEGGDIAFRVFPGNQLRSILEGAGGPTAETYELFLEMLDRAMGTQADKTKTSASGNQEQPAPSTSSSPAGGGSAIVPLQTAFRVLFESATAGYEHVFRTVVQKSNSRPTAGRTVSYWCFKPAIAMQTLRQLNMRCMLLTSGTLSPMDSFAAELGLDFPVRLENPHVVRKPQVWAGVIKTGPDHEGVKGNRLSSAFHQRGDASHLELGRSMIKIASLVPDGLLVFFPSYGSMYSCMDAWKRLGPKVGGAKPSVWECLLQRKQIVAEERESSKFAAAILAHRTNVDSRKGSILLAVCRGKVSEGIDFSDEYGRAVVITGLPYPSAFDPKVVLKREIADEEVKASRQAQRGQTSGASRVPVISGSEWYAIQALRAVNQALGRAIRHRYDYGAIILCEERFQSKQLQEQVSKWIRPNLGVCPSFRSAEESLSRFFEEAVNSSFAKEGEKKRLEARRRIRETPAAQAKPEEDTAAVLVAQEAINNLLPPQKTEKQFLDQMMSFSESLKSNDGKATGREKVAGHENGNKLNILGLSAEMAESGLRDSGSLRGLADTESIGMPTMDGSKRSAAFLAARAERKREGAGEAARGASRGVAKRVRLSQKPEGRAGGSAAKGAGKATLSQRIKGLFESKGEVREFLQLFQAVMAADARLRDGAGPLMTASEAQESAGEGRRAVRVVVEFVRERGRADQQGEFLAELRRKVPAQVRDAYDAAARGT